MPEIKREISDGIIPFGRLKISLFAVSARVFDIHCPRPSEFSDGLTVRRNGIGRIHTVSVAI
ncbi:hypothetical protein l13_06920 [Neisseria weaveri ATCC 51223]|nr:hypothetical protein l13_06920 [Neisseria weaveri ATCC 51223]